MPDFPRCQSCDGQTYKLAGKAKYHCSKCKLITNASDYEPEALLWKEKPKEYAKWKEKKQIAKSVA